MTHASGVYKRLAIKAETTFGVPAGAIGASIVPRTSSTLDLQKATYQSNTINQHQQVADFRHGVRTVSGSIAGELAPGHHAPLFSNLFRKAWTDGATTGAVSTIAASDAGPHFTRSAGSFLADGFKRYDIVTASGFTAADNNDRRFRITSLTATEMTVSALNGADPGIVDEAAGDPIILSVVGKKLWLPATGALDTSFTAEHYFGDVNRHEIFVGCKATQAQLSMPNTGLATTNFSILGKDRIKGSGAYFTTPTEAPNTASLAASNGVLRVGGEDLALVTGIQLTVNGQHDTDAVVGSNSTPGVFPGKLLVSGQFTALVGDTDALDDAFDGEQEIDIAVAMTTDESSSPDFLALTLPRIKLGSAGKDDGEKRLVQTLQFTALYDATGGAGTDRERTTITMQDSAA